MPKPRVLIVGAGGHGRVMLDVLQCQGESEVLGFIDDRPELAGREIGGLRVLGGPGDLAALEPPPSHFLVAIGSNAVRAELFGRWRARGLLPWSAVHPTATLAAGVRLGPGAQVVAGVIVNPEAVIGENVILNTACSVDHHCRVGDNAFIGPGARLGGEVRVGEGAFVGIGATILPGMVIGDRAVVGAGSVVTCAVPPGVVVVGVPAEVRSVGRHQG
jgi:sugar O-acyltransferase (sialic acid O-acetyltransferase NeuD family)